MAPLGVTSTMAATDQNRVLSALRTTEVVADPTNVLALECARRLRGAPTARARVHFATSQRVIRAQPVPNVKGYSQHFLIFVLASGGRETKDHGFTVESIVLHVRTMLAAIAWPRRSAATSAAASSITRIIPAACARTAYVATGAGAELIALRFGAR